MAKKKYYKYHYKCLNPDCNKEINTNKYYPYGWICSKCAKIIPLTVQCCDCKNPTIISWDVYRQKYPKDEYRCKDCFIKLQKKNGKSRWDNISKKDRQNYMQPCRVGLSKLTKEDKLNSNKKISISMKSFLNTLSYEEKLNRVKPANDGNKIKFSNLSKEEIDNLMSFAWNGHQQWFDNLSDIELSEHNNKISLSLIKFVNNQTYDDFIKIKYTEAINCNLKNVKDYNKEDYTNTEWIFKEILEKYKIEYRYQYYNLQIHPNFNKLFPTNPFSKRGNRDGYVSPYHQWDFLIKLYNKDIFVDIDGSIHDFNKIKDNDSFVKSYTHFSDQQRLYQTDNYNAYIVKCYNNKINDNTLVLDIQHNYTIYMETFINRLIREKEELKKRYDIKE